MKRAIRLIAMLFFIGLGGNSLHATSGAWINATTDGEWSDSTKWTSGAIAEGAGATASFPSLGSGVTRTVTLSTSHTIGSLACTDNGNGRAWTFSGTGTLTLAGLTPPLVRAISGGSTIVNVPLAGTEGVKAPNQAGIAVFNRANLYSGDTTIDRSTLRVGNVDALPHGSRLGNVIFIDNPSGGIPGVLDLSTLSITINGLSGTNPSWPGHVNTSANGSSVKLTVGDNNATSTFNGVIENGAGLVALTKIGTGTLVLTGANTFSGQTTVSNGTLLASGSLVGPVMVGAAGRFGAGAGAANLTLQNGVNLSGGGTCIWELSANNTSGPGVNFDQMVVSGGSLVLGGASKLSLVFTGSATVPNPSEPFWQAPHSWTIFSLGGVNANPGLSRFATLSSAQYPSLQYFTQYADTQGNIVLAYDPTSIFYALFDAGPGFFGGENLILTNAVGQTFYVWSSLDAGHSVTNWNLEGAMGEQPLNDGTGNSRYSINVTPAASPVYYIAVRTFGGAFPPTVAAQWITTDEFGGYTVFNTNVAINAAGVLAFPALPDIVRQPVNKTVVAGQSGMFDITANSFTALTYQWRSTPNTQLPDATNSKLTVATTTPGQVGTYDVIVANDYGSVTSSVAGLTVVPVPQLAAQKIGGGFQLSASGLPGVSYWVQATTNLSPPAAWLTLVSNVTAPDGLVQFVDTNTAANPQRYYRMVFP